MTDFFKSEDFQVFGIQKPDRAASIANAKVALLLEYLDECEKVLPAEKRGKGLEALRKEIEEIQGTPTARNF